jgi:preprotein translocase subunit SecD
MMLAGLIGTLLVMLFMIFYYRLLGVFAALALIIYIALTLGAFKLISVTLQPRWPRRFRAHYRHRSGRQCAYF